MLIKVKNLNGTTDNKKPTGFNSWKEFWEKKRNNEFPEYCSADNCLETSNLLGGHVKIVNETNKQYIVPICPTCNKRTDNYEVSDTFMVPVVD